MGNGSNSLVYTLIFEFFRARSFLPLLLQDEIVFVFRKSDSHLDDVISLIANLDIVECICFNAILLDKSKEL